MKSFVASVLVLAAVSNAFVLPQEAIMKRDEGCTPGLYNCLDGQHFQQCTAGKIWATTMVCSAGTACTPGISANPFIRAGDAAAPVAPAPAPPSKTDSPPPPPAASPPAASPPPPPPAGGDTTSTVTSSFTTSTTTLATVTSTAGVTDSPPPPPPAASPPAASPPAASPPAASPPVTSSVVDSPPPPPPASSSAASSTISDSPPPPPSATNNPGAGTGATVTKACFKFTSDNKDWSYSMQNPWGSATGTFGDLPHGMLCVDTNNDAGGAMYIGSTPNPGPGNTKLECYFPTTGVANCDNSLVDGYSLSVECTAGDAVIGSSVDLWTQGTTTCKDPGPGGICYNKNAYLDAESKVDDFFQAAGKTKNCIWWACNQDYFFPVTEQVNCHISGTVPSSP